MNDETEAGLPSEDEPTAADAEIEDVGLSASEGPAEADDLAQSLVKNVQTDFVGELPRDASPHSGGEAAIPSPATAESLSTPPAADVENELSPQRVAIELRRIETDVRAIIDPLDPKRKRKLTGTHRWQELQDDIITWQYSGRFEESQLQRLRELIIQRNHLFDHLRFLASTRPTWNS